MVAGVWQEPGRWQEVIEFRMDPGVRGGRISCGTGRMWAMNGRGIKGQEGGAGVVGAAIGLEMFCRYQGSCEWY